VVHPTQCFLGFASSLGQLRNQCAGCMCLIHDAAATITAPDACHRRDDSRVDTAT
jgi:hypothetical protein